MTDSISPIRRNAQRAVLIAMLMVVASSMAVTTKAEPMPGAAALAWTAQKAVIDFAAANGGRHLRTLVEDAHDKTILYLDWTMRDAARSGLFEKIRADGNGPVTDKTICEHIERRASRPGGVLISGKPDPDNNHLLFDMTLDLARGAPFARARCEYAENTYVLRLRGFFYVTNVGMATAKNLEFQPVAIPAHLVPATFLEHLR
ncbi:hypothetical protein [Aquibaculum arenosum]|uniref:Uncharacterized protein n=1 Tax=Aquibaculum arenosum TaxID=3032591 RepID=A0ABT5YRC5_9PROT|nr:hypothetical protein [Fodinicurvata sp. CAU 1616]MDF2097530.1 hypothetical protein [Fodinicurvata sp. CAU 1616]